MRLYTCSPKQGCGHFQTPLRFLNDWGIESALEQDHHGHYFEFETPEEWTAKRKRQFEAELSRHATDIDLPELTDDVMDERDRPRTKKRATLKRLHARQENIQADIDALLELLDAGNESDMSTIADFILHQMWTAFFMHHKSMPFRQYYKYALDIIKRYVTQWVERPRHVKRAVHLAKRIFKQWAKLISGCREVAEDPAQEEAMFVLIYGTLDYMSDAANPAVGDETELSESEE